MFILFLFYFIKIKIGLKFLHNDFKYFKIYFLKLNNRKGGKIANHTHDKKLVARIYKEFPKFNDMKIS